MTYFPHVTDYIARPAFFEDAACKGTDVNMFPTYFPEIEAAKKLCFSCPVRAECLEYGIEHAELGIYGGWGEKARREMRMKRRRGKAS